jgi:subtilisin family serine protease
MGFYLGELDESEQPEKSSLLCMQLPVVHEDAQGLGVRVAILDTGVDPDHPMLEDNLEIIDDTPLDEPFEQGDKPPGADAFGHGTHVAGAILQVAPEATLVPFKVLDEYGVGTDHDLAIALERALEEQVDIVNLSLKLMGESPVVEDLLEQLHAADIVVMAAAGNDGPGAEYPATDPHALAVASTLWPFEQCQHELALYSAYENVEFAAVGTDLVSTYPLPDGWDPESDDPVVAFGTGTSMACGVATGAAAVILGVGGAKGPPGDPLYYLKLHALDAGPRSPLVYGVVSPYDVLRSP